MALIRLMAPEMTTTNASWAMNRNSRLPAVKACSCLLPRTAQATAADTSSPTNIHTKAWVRKAAWSRASGLTPSADGDAYVLGVGIRFSFIGAMAPHRSAGTADPCE